MVSNMSMHSNRSATLRLSNARTAQAYYDFDYTESQGGLVDGLLSAHGAEITRSTDSCMGMPSLPMQPESKFVSISTAKAHARQDKSPRESTTHTHTPIPRQPPSANVGGDHTHSHTQPVLSATVDYTAVVDAAIESVLPKASDDRSTGLIEDVAACFNLFRVEFYHAITRYVCVCMCVCVCVLIQLIFMYSMHLRMMIIMNTKQSAVARGSGQILVRGS
jgi:hypothetical protein